MHDTLPDAGCAVGEFVVSKYNETAEKFDAFCRKDFKAPTCPPENDSGEALTGGEAFTVLAVNSATKAYEC